ncbi:MAG TPA: type IX secretion system membrane protein PorP/SprF [Bacteroidetes bacterium]|nr:type IX secretion system membrane protein PorP/SprF [Bacteroidota bacterium]
MSINFRKTALILFLFFLVGIPGSMWSQQDPMFSQYMHNGSAINPAYAGSRDALSLSLLYRQQWAGFTGAPTTQTFAAHLPAFQRRHGFGISLVNDQISYLNQSWLSLDYAFRIPVGNGHLALGLRATANQYRIGWGKSEFKDQTDQVITNYGQSFLLPNAGFGIYYHAPRAYFGIAIPRLLVNSFSTSSPTITLDESLPGSLRRHYFATAGFVIKASESVQIKPSTLLKYVYAAPVQLDLNLNVYFNNRFGVGASYRTKDAIIGLLDYFITPQLRVGYAYGYPITAINGYTSGSHELMLSYDFRFGKDGIASPRLF